MSGGLYIALAICILSVICIGVYSAIINVFDTSLLNNSTTLPPNSTSAAPSPSATVTTPKAPVTTKAVHEEVPKETEGTEVVIPPQSPQEIGEVTSFSRPVAGEVVKEYSGEILVYSQTMNDYRTHCGVDLKASAGDAVKSFAKGTVSEVFDDPLMGQTIVIDHGSGLKSVYQNLSSTLPDGMEVGKSVEEGEVIAGVGETSLIECEQETHLHFEVLKDGKNVDPMEYFG